MIRTEMTGGIAERPQTAPANIKKEKQEAEKAKFDRVEISRGISPEEAAAVEKAAVKAISGDPDTAARLHKCTDSQLDIIA